MRRLVSILDYGSGNVGSVMRMIERSGGEAQRIATADEVLAARKLILPGVGAFDHGIGELRSRGLLPALSHVALERRIPVLGICLGMQLMCFSSEEGVLPGLGWIDAEVSRLNDAESSGLRVPHMGWNTVSVVKENPLLPISAEERRFYFVHSYRVRCNDPSDPVALTHYGADFVAAFQRGNIYGVQFHPEKSHRFGVDLIRRFLEVPCA